MKKFISCLLVVACLLSGIPLPISAAQGDSATFTVGSGKAAPGGKVTITVDLDCQIAGGFAMTSLQVDYDPTYLMLESVVPGSALDGIASNGNGFSSDNSSFSCYNGVDASISFVPKGTEFAILTFSVSQDAPPGEYEIGLSAKEALLDLLWMYGGLTGTDWFYEFDLNAFLYTSLNVNPNVNKGKITVSSTSIQAGSYDVVWSYGGTVEPMDTGTQALASYALIPPDDGEELPDGDYEVNPDTDVTNVPLFYALPRSGDTVSYKITPIEGYDVDQIWVDGAKLSSSDYSDEGGYYIWRGTAPERSLVVFFAYTLKISP